MRSLGLIGAMLAFILFSLFSIGDGAVHRGHRHHHNDKVIVIARATTPAVSLITSTVTVGAYDSILAGSATPCSGPVCVTAIPTTSRICPAGNQTAWTGLTTSQKYTVICEVDFPAQNIYPFVLAGSFEECMAQCESYNNDNTGGDLRCEGFVFAPERLHSGDDCYLKSSLHHPFPATISLVGATRLALLPSTAMPIRASTGSGMSLSPWLRCFNNLTAMT